MTAGNLWVARFSSGNEASGGGCGAVSAPQPLRPPHLPCKADFISSRITLQEHLIVHFIGCFTATINEAVRPMYLHANNKDLGARGKLTDVISGLTLLDSKSHSEP